MCGEDQLEKSSQHQHKHDRGVHEHPQLNEDAYPLPTAAGILGLALPALGVLLATPVFLLLDTAVVGHVGGAVMLAALAAGTTLYGIVTTQLTFLSYGTTARSARFFGQGNTAQAIAEGVQATWLAVGIGLILALCMFVGAPWFTLWLSADEQVSALATSWLRVACMGIPLVLIQMAGNGWLRGIQNTKAPLVFTLAGVIPGAALIPVLVIRMGIVGSAWATVAGTAIEACCFLTALVRAQGAHGGRWRPQPKVMRQQLVLGRDLIVRSLSFQIAFVSAAAVAGRMGASSLAAHQVLLQLWNFLSLALDSLAIAAQSLVGAALGAGSVRAAKKVGQKVVWYSALFSAVLAVVLGAGFQVIPRLFTVDVSVLSALAGPWWQLVGMIVVGGVVFALDGVLLGAADAAFLRTVTVCAVLCGFLPGVWLALVFGTGLVGVWWGIVAFMVIRLAGVVFRFGSMKWAQVAQL
ncbi:MATE family efflux transporter [Corynebacterium felinum]|uniref:MATE family efflux protein n=1 Tax=Corynebacterium felinum TaxID=131318 RepID=A0ABU2BBC8_9CORY|nr:MATE family efflux transporter [Corynebacterium felinum]MDF5819912.1 MATE family efflux transporter [Corynebacterium felinum]MDR7355944.1 putative MATE family efflux protein [Corynebacterium felinum]WJY95282.1 DNA-damage-inducible protein F [Corynebacterium felinum]